jgi:hypothetical protein
MDFEKRGYTVIDVPPLAPRVLDEYDTLPLDPYCGGRFRSRRFSQYRLGAARGQWILELLPHRPFMQSKEYNRLVGGVPRHFEPLRFDPTPQIAAGARAARLDPQGTYQINVHQVRVRANREIVGTAVPEGPHRDGHEIGMVAVFRRGNVSGGVTQLMPTGGGAPFFETILQPNQAVVYEDGKMWHNATDILPIDEDADGVRDIWIVAINRWENRRYGPEFEARAAA